jgi:hypothetical protein
MDQCTAHRGVGGDQPVDASTVNPIEDFIYHQEAIVLDESIPVIFLQGIFFDHQLWNYQMDRISDRKVIAMHLNTFIVEGDHVSPLEVPEEVNNFVIKVTNLKTKNT